MDNKQPVVNTTVKPSAEELAKIEAGKIEEQAKLDAIAKEEADKIAADAKLAEDKLAEDAKLEAEIAKAKEDAEKAEELAKHKAKTIGDTKHVVTYVGNGVWVDEKGKVWSRSLKSNSEVEEVRTYLEKEFVLRTDLHFMIEYGAMTHTEV